ncbi:hypothetical protein ZWY2020_048623 [Hordeum vulgare]|nr:hypothetical protein ZWY2020_048623 [Hordeum vulgare]
MAQRRALACAALAGSGSPRSSEEAKRRGGAWGRSSSVRRELPLLLVAGLRGLGRSSDMTHDGATGRRPGSLGIPAGDGRVHRDRRICGGSGCSDLVGWH